VNVSPISGEVSFGPVLTSSLPPASFEKSTTFSGLAVSLLWLSSTRSVPEIASPSTPTSEAVPEAISAV
jgi:hypothetical protein